MNYFPEAIEIVTDDDVNHRGVLSEVAKKNPGVVVKAYNSMKQPRSRERCGAEINLTKGPGLQMADET